MKRVEFTEQRPSRRPGRQPRSPRIGLSTGSTQPEILTIQDLATHLRVPVSTAYRLAQQRQLPGRKVGRHWRFSRPLLDAWLMLPELRDDAAGHDGALSPPVANDSPKACGPARTPTPAAEVTGEGLGVGALGTPGGGDDLASGGRIGGPSA
ncbi:MAG: helix-turn-helix domain-containing protein [Candidatus Rokuibacteriota bacterium]